MKVYIAGPMSGHELFNFPAFDAARDLLLNVYWQPVSPADIDREYGFDPASLPSDYDWSKLPDDLDMKEVVERDIKALLECDAIFMLNGWEKSVGARAEHGVAVFAGLLVIYE